MKVSDLFPGLHKPPQEKPRLIIANRAPTQKDKQDAQWWYDRTTKVMYRATEEGYVKD